MPGTASSWLSNMKQALLLVAACAVLLGGVLLFAGKRQTSSIAEVTDRTTREVALACDPGMAQVYHIHPVLSIIVDGEKVGIPSDVGVRSTCMTVLHTHTPDGVIHVESPEKRDFTLADFFAVWEQSFSKDKILSYEADADHRIRITVDGIEVDTYENTILRDAQHIVITYESI